MRSSRALPIAVSRPWTHRASRHSLLSRQPAARHRAALLCTPLLCIWILAGCETVKESGRQQFVLFNESEMQQLAARAYAEETSKYPIITGTPAAQMVQKVGADIAKASGRDYAWEFKLLDAPDVVNAFALPGGKIAVYSGLLDVTKDADGLAVVVGHEVAHATSRHGAERMSHATLAQAGLGTAAAVLDGWDRGSETTKKLVLGGLGLAGTGTVQKFSRNHESEADAIGLEFMMRAGYEPEAAPALWERMAKLSDRQPGLLDAFFASHPPSLERAEALRKLIPVLRAKLGQEKRVQPDVTRPKK